MINAEQNDYWFYLEPYSFIFNEGDLFIVYNTLNSSYINYSHNPLVCELLRALQNSTEGYAIDLQKEYLSDNGFMEFLNQIRSTYTGDIIKNNQNSRKPYIMKPLLRLYSSTKNLHEKQENLLSLNILVYLNELSLFFGENCTFGCDNCGNYYKQFNHCTCGLKQELTAQDYLDIFDKLSLCELAKVNFVIGNVGKCDILFELLNKIKEYTFKKEVVVPYCSIHQLGELLYNEDVQINVMVHFPVEKESIENTIKQYEKFNLHYSFIVSNESDLEFYSNLSISDTVHTELLPFYNGNNIPFFEENVFNDFEDIIAIPVKKQSILRRQALNEHFFGKIAILPDGEVHPNLNFKSIGNIKMNKLSEIVFREVREPNAWLKIRDYGECKDCVNKFLCPSISNYEVVLGRTNLCNLKTIK